MSWDLYLKNHRWQMHFLCSKNVENSKEAFYSCGGLTQSLCLLVANVIDLRKTKKSLVDICMDETGGLGVDCVIDNGGKRKSHKLLLRGSALTLCRSLALVLSGHFSY